jgi:hypothetical protein
MSPSGLLKEFPNMPLYTEYRGEVVRRKVVTTVRTEDGREVDFTEGQRDDLLPGSEVSFVAANILGRTAIMADSLKLLWGPGKMPGSLTEAVRCGEL